MKLRIFFYDFYFVFFRLRFFFGLIFTSTLLSSPSFFPFLLHSLILSIFCFKFRYLMTLFSSKNASVLLPLIFRCFLLQLALSGRNVCSTTTQNIQTFLFKTLPFSIYHFSHKEAFAFSVLRKFELALASIFPSATRAKMQIVDFLQVKISDIFDVDLILDCTFSLD